ncbi:MAG: zinc ABC transporter substrate-binding protein, partial [Dehalococcoidia bacterium]
VHVVNLTPPGAEPHDWEPGAQDIISILKADLFTYNGSGFEPWVDRVLEEAHGNEAEILNATDALGPDLSPGEGQGPADPHVWLDPGLYLKQAVAVKQALAAIDPEGDAQYSENLASLEQDLKVLESEMEKGLSACALNVFVINHASFGYLARRFGLEQLSISGLSPEAESSPARLRKLVNQIEDSGIGYVFFESLVSPRVAETLAKEVGAQTLELNPLEGLTSEEQEAGEDYFSVMRSNLDNLKKALQCR